MKNIIIVIFLLISSVGVSAQTAWYVGGTLHDKNLSDWNRASEKNKLATCGDFVATSTKKIDRRKSEELRDCIEEVAKENDVRHFSISSIAVLCMAEMGY